VSVFPDGSHERIWYGMAKGCAIATDFSRFMAEDFSAGESILFWPEDAREIAEMVTAAVADPDRLREITAAAGSVYAAKHTWRKRVRIIDEALNG
jgi:glycosyltransferase involved in cell wall biosynthesis